MISWAKRAASALSGGFLMALLFPVGSYWGGAAGAALNLALSMAEKFPYSLRRFLPPLVLLINTVLSAYGVLTGGLVTWAVLVAGLSLFSWNAGLFEQRWPQAPLPVQYRYLRRIGGILTLGLGAGLSAVAWQGNFSLPFFLAFLSMLAGGVLLLRLVSQTLPKGW
jgi:hypothetical protein